jgi:hypothetical protein
LTKRGEPICNFVPHHKVPFESLLLAARHPIDALPHEFVFASVPSAIHSRKPPLQLLLSRYFIDQQIDELNLELFARYLLPNTVSIGNECIKLQNVNYFDKIE